MKNFNLHITYAQALYKVAAAHDKAEEVLADLANLAQLLKDQNLRELLQQMMYLEASVKEKVLDHVFKNKLQVFTLNLLKILARRKRILLLSKIVQAYRHTFHEQKGIVDMKLRTARKLSSEEEQNFIETLRAKKDQPVNIQFEADASLIGGIQIYEKGSLMDMSVKNYLENLRRHLLTPNNY